MRINNSLKRVIASLVIAPAIYFTVTCTEVVYAGSNNPPTLLWRSMDTNEVTESNRLTPKIALQTQPQQDNVVNLIATMQQQQQQNMALILAALQPKTQSNDNAVLNAMQQQQQQVLNTLMQMQQQQNQNMMLMITALQQNKNDTASALAAAQQQQQQNQFGVLLKLLDNRSTDEIPDISRSLGITKMIKPDYSEPVTIEPMSDTSGTQDYVPYKRARLAPPDEPNPGKAPTDFITEAVQDAALEGYYKDSMAVFNYGDAALYKIYCKEGYLTVIRLQPGENIVSVNGGDTSRWIVDHIAAGGGETVQAQVMLKPVRSGLDTNFVIVTDKHTYQIQAKSTSWYNPIVSWTYPHEERAARYKLEEKMLKTDRETIATGAQKPEQLYFNYKISTRGDVDAWKPVTVFDDGKKVYIKMSDSMKYGEAPALLLRDNKGKTVLVNYRMKNEYYIVDRLFKEAELRLGTKDYVRIKRVEAVPGEE